MGAGPVRSKGEGSNGAGANGMQETGGVAPRGRGLMGWQPIGCREWGKHCSKGEGPSGVGANGVETEGV